MSLSLKLPEKDPKLADFVELRPKAVRDWLAALPNHHPMDAGRQILDALASCNRVEVDPEERVKLLDEYHSALALLAGGFEELYLSQGLPLRDKARQAALLARSLWLELADGYKVALVERLEKRFVFGGSKLAPQLLHQIIAIHYRLFQISCRVSMVMPEGVWLETHRLFRHGVEQRWLEETRGEPGAPTTSIYYKRLLLLSLADPLRFAPDEQARLIDVVDNYAHYAHFQPVVQQQASAAGFFLVRLDVDEAPNYIGRAVDDYQGTAMLVDTIDLGKKLHRVLAGLEAKAPTAGDRAKLMAWMDTVRRLIKQWSIAPKRVFQRIRNDASVELCHGLRAAAQSQRHNLPPFGDGHYASAGLDGMPYSAPWRVINESPGGYAVTTRDAPPERLHAGDMVGLRPEGSGPWMVAAIRWLQQCEDGAIEMGLQILAARADVVLLRPTVGLVDAQYEPALLLPEITTLRQPPLLATIKGHYAPLRELSLLTESGPRTVRAAKLVEQQMGYDLFEYTDS
ncbi:hypothetical protein GCM10007860_29770 [Chitiniphilus shinanonensis]|uniref:Uncharacterized protein n=1 Tax=Chitiniphilus shinanonensis TaxID=553088 RepID=A0ABQ6BVX0_9NEIS|nr:hypothetical protein [Chitiniphilus shinanonensis]GLS05819.1 hypothetical protein GCM10007860_29770 [Chitiniphilus shinanonensis]